MRVLEGKVAVVTGGSSGIGRAASLAFARAGARVVLAARGAERGEDTVREISEIGGVAKFVRTDLAKSSDIENLFDVVVREFGRIDCAFNNAATEAGAFAPTADFSEEQFDYTMGVNLKAVWLCMKHEINQMLRQMPAGGAIVNTSSVNGLGGARQGSLYSASKAGILALTKSAAQEYGPSGIRVNALVAGAFRTPMLEKVFERFSAGDPQARQSVESRYADLSPLGRIGDPREAANVVVWLCSDSSSFVTGHSMIVDGGMTASMR